MSPELIPVAIFSLVLGVLLFFIYRLLHKRKKKHAERYEGDLEQFAQALKEKNIEQINFYGDRIIWNE